MRSLLATLVILLVLKQGFGEVSDNICEQQCEFCCRNHVCQTKSYCENGDTNYYAIIGGVVGGIVGLIVLRVVYVKLIRPRCCHQRAKQESDEPKSRASRYKSKDGEGEDKDKDKKKKKKGVGVGNKKKGKKLTEDIESKGEKKSEKYDALGGNSISTPNASVINKPGGADGSIITHSRQDLENPEVQRVEENAKEKERSDSKGPAPDLGNSKVSKSHKSGTDKSKSQKSGEKSQKSGDMSKSKSGETRSKSRDKSAERSRSKDKSSGSTANKMKGSMTTSTRSKRGGDGTQQASRSNVEQPSRSNVDNQV